MEDRGWRQISARDRESQSCAIFHPLSSILLFVSTRQRVPGEAEVFDDLAADQVFLDDALGVVGGDALVPRAFGVDDGDGAGGADAEAVALGAEAGAVLAGEVEVFHPPLDVVPGLL